MRPISRTHLACAGTVPTISTAPGDLGGVRPQCDPSSPSSVAVRLLRYLTKRFGVNDLRYRARPRPITDGWETYIYHFQLESNSALPPAFSGPLTLRLFAGPRGIPQGRHQFEVQGFMQDIGYPVPTPICWEEKCDSLGGPFAIMEQLVGPTFLQAMIYRPWHLLTIAAKMAEMHAWLHILPAQGFATDSGDLLNRSLEELADVIRDYDLEGLNEGLDYLRTYQPAPPTQGPRLLHLDFHPINLIERPQDSPGVLDWDSADVGDPHADVATTVMLIATANNPGTNTWERMSIWGGRQILSYLYLRSYEKWLPLDETRLAYYRAWAALRRLARYGRWLNAGPQITGAKHSLLSRLKPNRVKRLGRYFRNLTDIDVRVSLPETGRCKTLPK